MIATFVTRAVFAAALSFSSYSAQGTHSSTPEIELQYHYEPSNDDSHHSTRISCLTSITLHFSSAASVASLGGAVTASSRFRGDRPLRLVEYTEDGSRAMFSPLTPMEICDVPLGRDTLKVNTIRLVNGLETQSTSVTLHFPEATDSLPRWPATRARIFEPLDRTPPPSNNNPDHCDARVGENCIVNLLPSDDLSPVHVSNAHIDMMNWLKVEREKNIYRMDGIVRMPTSDTIIEPRGQTNGARHFGFLDTILVTRKAAKFVANLFPDLQVIGIADMTTQEGDTPYTTWPDGSRQYLHPEGSHQGQDVDIGYIGGETGNDRNAPIDIEKSFWFLYAAMQTAGVDLVYTAYKEQFVTYAKAAFAKGLIGELGMNRIDSPRIILDNELNHDTHMHLKIAYRDYRGKSLRFTIADDAYNCMLGLTSLARSPANFCL